MSVSLWSIREIAGAGRHTRLDGIDHNIIEACVYLLLHKVGRDVMCSSNALSILGR